MRKSLKSNDLSSIIRLVSNCKFLILWVIGLFFLSGAIIAPLEAADGTGSISGRVTVDPSGEPVLNGKVQAFDANWNFVGMGGISLDGYYTLSDLSPGSYYVRIFAPKYMPEVYDDICPFPWPPAGATLVSVIEGEDTPNINFALEKGGSISGRVTVDLSGEPISGVKVPVFDVNGNLVGVAKTDSEGYYTTTGLLTDNYYIRTENNQGYIDEVYDNIPCLGTWPPEGATLVHVNMAEDTPDKNFALQMGGSISGRVVDQATAGPLDDASCGSIDLGVGWHKFVYRHQEYNGGQASRAAFKTPGDTDWRWFSTSELTIKTTLDPGAQTGILLINKKNTWDEFPQDHEELVKCVDLDSTEESGWYGSGVVPIVNQNENIHGNDDYYTSHYECYFYVDTAGKWYFSTDSDDASEICIDDKVVAYWYGGHGCANRWEHKVEIRVFQYESNKWIASTRGNYDGTYKFSSLPSGSYRLQADAPGYVIEFYNETPSWDEAIPIVVNASEDTLDINFTLEKVVPGDANGDGSINVQDVICIINVILDTGTASGNPDCNEDGNVNVLDVICVINKILGG